MTLFGLDTMEFVARDNKTATTREKKLSKD